MKNTYLKYKVRNPQCGRDIPEIINKDRYDDETEKMFINRVKLFLEGQSETKSEDFFDFVFL